MSLLRPAVMLFILLALITGGLYPLTVTGLGQWLFSKQANGSLIYQDKRPVASRLIATEVSRADRFQPRPSASAQHPWNPALSGGSNLAADNPVLINQVRERVTQLRAQNPQAGRPIPVELITASASGIDPNLTPAAADYQIPRISAASGIAVARLQQLVAQNTVHPWPGFIGQPVVNVVTLNQALDAQAPSPAR